MIGAKIRVSLGIELDKVPVRDIWTRQVPVSRGAAPTGGVAENSHSYYAVAMERVSLATISGCRGTLPLHNISISGLQVRAFGVRRLRRERKMGR